MSAKYVGLGWYFNGKEYNQKQHDENNNERSKICFP